MIHPLFTHTRAVFGLAPTVMFSIAANAAVSLGIGKQSVTSKPWNAFPYIPAVTLRTGRSSARFFRRERPGGDAYGQRLTLEEDQGRKTGRATG